MQPTSKVSFQSAFRMIKQARPSKKKERSPAAAAVVTSDRIPPAANLSQSERADFHLQRKELDLAVEAYTQVLKEGEEKKDQDQLATALKGLGAVFMEKEQWTFSAKLFNGAYTLATPNSTLAKVCLGQMVEVERRFLQKVCGVKSDKRLKQRTEQAFLNNRRKLQAIRQKMIDAIREKKQSTAELFALYSADTAKFLDELVLQLYPVLDKPPCKYTLVGLGSLARREMSPYSDLEFALLVEKNTPKHAAYFRKLVKLLELEVIHLGETEIKVLNHGLGSPINRGFSFDDGGNTPLGKESYVELLGAPSDIARFQTERFFNEDLILSNVLKTVSRLVGDEKLYRTYLDEIQAILAGTSHKPPLLIREERALNILQGHLVEFEPRIDKQKEDTPLFNVKAELYRLPNMLLSALADYYGIQEGNTWDKISALQQKKIISETGANNLKKALDAILHLRARTHLHYRRECDDVFHPSIKRKNAELVAKTVNAFELEDKDIETIIEIYRVLFPLHRSLEELSLNRNFSSLQNVTFYDDSPLAQGQAHRRLCQYTQAKECLHKAVALNPSDSRPLKELSETLYLLSEFEKAQEYAQKAAAIAQETKNKRLYSTVCNLIGLIYYCEGKKQEAVKVFEECLEVDKELRGDGHLEVATYLNNLGLAYRSLGKIPEATLCLEKALEVDRKIYGKEHPNVARNLSNLGVILCDSGKVKDGLFHLLEALSIYQNIYGIEHQDTAVSLNNLGTAEHLLGNYKDAMKYFKEALRTINKIFGDDHPKTATALNNIGMLLIAQGDAKKALIYLEKAQSVCRKIYGSNHQELANILNNLATLQLTLGNFKEAARYSKEAIHIYRDIHEEEHKNFASCLSNLGSACIFLKDISNGISYIEEAIRINKKLLGNNHQDIARDLNNLGSAYHRQGNITKARSCYEKSLDITIEILGDTHPGVAKLLNNIGTVLRDSKDASQSIPYFEKAVNIYKEKFGSSHPDLLSVIHNLALADMVIGNELIAVRRYRELLSIEEERYVNSKLEIAKSYCKIALALYILGRNDEYEDYIRKSLGLVLKNDKDQLKQLSLVYYQVANAYKKAEQYSKAIKIVEKMLEFDKKIFGEENSEIVSDLEILSELYGIIGDTNNKIKYLRNQLQLQELITSKITNTMLLKSYQLFLSVTLCKLGVAYQNAKNFLSATEIFSKMLALNIEVYGEEHREILRCLKPLGESFKGAGDFAQAVQTMSRELRLMRKLDGETKEVAVRAFAIGEVLVERDCYQPALAVFEECLEIAKTAFGVDNQSTKNVLETLIKTCLVCGESEKAIGYKHEQLKILKESMGDHARLISQSLYELGELMVKVKRYSSAREVFDEMIALDMQTHGETYGEVFKDLKLIIELFNRTGMADIAFEYLKQELALLKKLKGETKEVAMVVWGYVEKWIKEESHQQAHEVLEENRELFKTVFGEESESYRVVMRELAVLYEKFSESEKGIAAREEVLKIARKIYSNHHEKTSLALFKLAEAHKSAKHHSLAIKYYEEKLACDLVLHGEEHQEILTDFTLIGHLHQEAGNHAQAAQTMRRELQLMKRLKGESIEVALRMRVIADHLVEMKCEQHAFDVLEECLELYRKISGEEIKPVLKKLARVCNRLGKVERAVVLRQEVVKRIQQAESIDVDEMSIALYLLAEAYRMVSDYNKAVKTFEEVLALDKNMKGETHEEVAVDLRALGFVYYQMGQFNRAEAAFQEALAIEKKQDHANQETLSDTLNHLGVLYRDWGRLNESIQILASSDPVSRRHDLGLTYCFSGNYREGIALLEQSLLTDQDLGMNHGALGYAYSLIGQWEKAKQHFLKAEEILTQASTKPYRLGKLMRYKGEFFIMQGKWDEAEQALNTSLGILQKWFGENHYEVAFSEIALAEVLLRKGHKENGAARVDRALTELERGGIAAHPYVGRAYRLRGLCIGQKSWIEKGLALHRDIRPDHLDVAVDLVSLERLEEAVSVFKHVYGDVLPQEVIALHRLEPALKRETLPYPIEQATFEAMMSSDMTQHKEAYEEEIKNLKAFGEKFEREKQIAQSVACMKQELQLTQKLRGDTKPVLARAIAIGDRIIGMHCQQEAREVLEACLLRARKILGNDDQLIYDRLAALFSKNGDLQRAADLRAESLRIAKLKKVGEPKQISSAYHLLIHALIELKDYPRAIEVILECIECDGTIFGKESTEVKNLESQLAKLLDS